MEKKCHSCDTVKDLTKFNKNKGRSDGHAGTCRECMKTYKKENYESNKKQYIQNVSDRRKALKQQLSELMLDYLKSHPCVDCGFSDPRALEFDHRDPSMKTMDVSRMRNNCVSWASMLREIEKCDVRCANCHRIRTSNQFLQHRSDWV